MPVNWCAVETFGRAYSSGLREKKSRDETVAPPDIAEERTNPGLRQFNLVSSRFLRVFFNPGSVR